MRFLLPPIVAIAALHANVAHAEADTEFLFFPFVQAAYLSDLAADSELDNNEQDFGIDLFAAFERDRFQFLGEALVAKDEQEIERLQLGWRLKNGTAWLGRFHNPIGYWNTQFHHGQFMQTSITRPAIDEFEDDGGILPAHLAGLLVEGIHEQGDRGLGYAFALATGPELSDGLEAFDVLSPSSGSQDLALTVNIYRQPLAYGANQYGLFGSYSEIPATDRGLDEVRQAIAGGYWNWEWEFWRLIGSGYYVHNSLDGGLEDQTDEFVAGYIQAERIIAEDWVVFGRAEKTFAGDNAPYLALFPNYVRQKLLAGLRVNLGSRNALTIEISGNKTLDDHFGAYVLQWAAMF